MYKWGHNAMTGTTPLLTPNDVAAQLQVTTRTIYAYIREGMLPAVKLGHRTVRIHQHDVDKLIYAAAEDDSECN